MALDRKDIRAKLNPDMHAALRAICESDGLEMGEWIEALLVPIIEKKIHEVMVLADAFQRAGITGNTRE